MSDNCYLRVCVRDRGDDVNRVKEHCEFEEEERFPGYVALMESAANYGYTDELAAAANAGAVFIGHHGHGSNYDRRVFVSDGASYIELSATEGLGAASPKFRAYLVDSVPCARVTAAEQFGKVDGVVEDDVEEAKRFWRLATRAHALFEEAALVKHILPRNWEIVEPMRQDGCGFMEFEFNSRRLRGDSLTHALQHFSHAKIVSDRGLMVAKPYSPEAIVVAAEILSQRKAENTFPIAPWYVAFKEEIVEDEIKTSEEGEA